MSQGHLATPLLFMDEYMKKILILLGMLFSNVAFSGNIEVFCWSSNKLIFHKYVNEVFYTDDSIEAVDDKNTYFLFASCVVRYSNKPA